MDSIQSNVLEDLVPLVAIPLTRVLARRQAFAGATGPHGREAMLVMNAGLENLLLITAAPSLTLYLFGVLLSPDLSTQDKVTQTALIVLIFIVASDFRIRLSSRARWRSPRAGGSSGHSRGVTALGLPALDVPNHRMFSLRLAVAALS